MSSSPYISEDLKNYLVKFKVLLQNNSRSNH